MAGSDDEKQLPVWLERRSDSVRIRVRVQPRASRTEIVGEHGSALRIRVAAPPVEGEANRELCRFIAKRVGVAQSMVSVVAGESAKDKLISIRGVTAIETCQRLCRC